MTCRCNIGVRSSSGMCRIPQIGITAPQTISRRSGVEAIWFNNVDEIP